MRYLKNKTVIASIAAFVAVLLVWLLYAQYEKPVTVKDLYPVSINGEVQGIDQHDGLRVRLKDENQYYLLTDYCNESRCLKDQITFKDSLKKAANSDMVILQKKYTGEVSEWKLRK